MRWADWYSGERAGGTDAACGVLSSQTLRDRGQVESPESQGGTGVPPKEQSYMSLQTFSALGVSEAVERALAARGITEPFPVQTRVIPDALAGRDLLVRSPTGSGKSLAFGLPLVERVSGADPRPAALVLVPTRELAAQIVEELHAPAQARGLAVCAVYGGTGIDRQARAARRSHIVVATPGRLEDLLSRGEITLGRVQALVLDEADRMLDMGFKPAVDRIVRQAPRARQTMLFSATLDAAVRELAREYTTDAVRHEEGPGPTHGADVEHRFVRLAHDEKLDALVRELRHGSGRRTLVFVRTKRGADRLVKRLRPHGVEAVAMHGDKSQSQRERALRRFAGGETDLLIATDVAARGLDVDGITHVISFDAPGQREDYVHRVGRTGRAGASGIGITFVAPDQAHELARIARELGLREQFEAGHPATAADRSRPVGAVVATPRRRRRRRARRATAANRVSTPR
jgi:ATP-dependent RNA helicase RhlE